MRLLTCVSCFRLYYEGQNLVSCQTISLIRSDVDPGWKPWEDNAQELRVGTKILDRNLAETSDKAAPYRLEDQIGFKLRLANQRHLEIFNRRMPDITPTQFAVLAKLRDETQISQNQLGRLVGMDAATTKGVVDRLRKKGLVQSAPSDTDMRRLEISLTDEGGAVATQAIAIARDISTETVGNLTPREVERLLALLDKL